jgi:hypothetical protein
MAIPLYNEDKQERRLLSMSTSGDIGDSSWYPVVRPNNKTL